MIGCEHIRIETTQEWPTVWELSHIDYRGGRNVIAEFRDGPLQRRLVLETANAAAREKLVGIIEIGASADNLAKLDGLHGGFRIDADW